MNSAFSHFDDRYDHRAILAQSSRAETMSTTEGGNMKKYQDNVWQGSGFFHRLVMPMLLLLTALAAGCGGSADTTNGTGSTSAVSIKLNTPADITDVSADIYDNNVSGLITGVTLKRWKDNWLASRPAGITGKLVILQVTAGEQVPIVPTPTTGPTTTCTAAYCYFQSTNAATPNNAPTNVLVFLAAGPEWV